MLSRDASHYVEGRVINERIGKRLGTPHTPR